MAAGQAEEEEEVDHREARHQAPLARQEVLRAHPQALADREAAGVQVVPEIRAQPGETYLGFKTAGKRANREHSSSSAIGPSYGGGRYYGGGSTSAYRSGGRSPAGILPFALGGAALGIFPGLWLYGAYSYNYNNPYNFRNRSDPNGQNQSLPVTCLCQQYSACGCDDTNNSTFLDSVVGNGSTADENSTLVHIGNVNGTKTIILNGTLPNGTDTDNSTDNSSSSTSSTGAATRNYVLENSGFWLVGAIVGATIWLM